MVLNRRGVLISGGVRKFLSVISGGGGGGGYVTGGSEFFKYLKNKIENMTEEYVCF